MNKNKIVIGMAVFTLCLGLTACVSVQENKADQPKDITTEDKTSNNAEPQLEVESEKVLKYTDSLDDPNVDYIAEIKNTGSQAVKLSDISIDLEGTDGNIINSVSMVSAYPDIVNPGESTFICESLLSTGEKVNLDNVGKALLHYDVEEHELAIAPNVSITEVAPAETYGHIKYVGRVENLAGDDIEDLYVIAPIKDANGDLQAVAFSIVDSLKAGEKKGFDLNIISGDDSTDFSQSTLSAIAYLK